MGKIALGLTNGGLNPAAEETPDENQTHGGFGGKAPSRTGDASLNVAGPLPECYRDTGSRGGGRALSEADAETAIATYTPWKALPVLILLVVCAAILLSGWFYALRDPADFFHFGAYRTYAVVVGSILYALYLPRFLRFFRQVLFRRMAAAWVANGSLIYIDPTFFNIRCADIAKIDLELFGPYQQEGVAVVQKDGKKRMLPVGLLSESSDLIVERMKKTRQQ